MQPPVASHPSPYPQPNYLANPYGQVDQRQQQLPPPNAIGTPSSPYQRQSSRWTPNKHPYPDVNRTGDQRNGDHFFDSRQYQPDENPPRRYGDRNPRS
jgi:hypothetical protein